MDSHLRHLGQRGTLDAHSHREHPTVPTMPLERAQSAHNAQSALGAHNTLTQTKIALRPSCTAESARPIDCHRDRTHHTLSPVRHTACMALGNGTRYAAWRFLRLVVNRCGRVKSSVSPQKPCKTRTNRVVFAFSRALNPYGFSGAQNAKTANSLGFSRWHGRCTSALRTRRTDWPGDAS